LGEGIKLAIFSDEDKAADSGFESKLLRLSNTSWTNDTAVSFALDSIMFLESRRTSDVFDVFDLFDLF
jgi:hypothetical protein